MADVNTVTRSVVSDMDRQRPTVRIGLLCVQVLILLGLLVAGLGPLLWLLKSALSTSQDILREPMALWPSGIQWHNLPDAWTKVRIGAYLGNTAWVAIGSWLANLFICTTGGYVLSVLRPKWGKFLSGAVLATLFIPGIISLVPLYLTVLHMPLVGVSLQNTYWAVWLPAAANAFNVMVIKRFFDALPRDLFEAARIDGAGPVRVFAYIVLPLSRPILGVISLLAVIAAWKDYLWPLLVLTDPSKQPISVALPRVQDSTPLSLQMGALFLALIIPVILFLIFQKQFLRGIGTAGAIKG